MPSVLIVDDLPAVHELLDAVISPAGFVSSFSLDAREALERYREEHFDVVLADISMQPMDGLTLLREIKAFDRHAIVVMMTGFASVETAVKALKLGAFDYVMKPFKLEELVGTLQRASSTVVANAAEGVGCGTTKVPWTASRSLVLPGPLSGESQIIKNLNRQVQKVVAVKSPVLIQGERGTGMEELAHLIHAEGPHKAGPVHALDCGRADPDALAESLLALDGSPGSLFGKAGGGTLLMREIQQLAPALQDLLASALACSPDCRLICTQTVPTLADPDDRCFTDEFAFQIASFPLLLPPLRLRVEDIPSLVHHILKQGVSPWYAPDLVEFTTEAEDLLSAYPWPGNVAELWNVICAVTAVVQGRQIRAEHLPRRIRSLHTWPSLAQHLEERRVAYLREMLRCAGRDREQAARLADVSEKEFDGL